MEKGLVPALIMSALVHGALLHLLGSQGHEPAASLGPLNLSVALISSPATAAPRRPAEPRTPVQPLVARSQARASQPRATAPAVLTPPAASPAAPVAAVKAPPAETSVAAARPAAAKPEALGTARQQGWFDLSPVDFMRETYLASLRKHLALHLQSRLHPARQPDGGPAVRVDLALLPGGRLGTVRVTGGAPLSGLVERALADGLTLPPPPQALSDPLPEPSFLVGVEQGEVVVR